MKNKLKRNDTREKGREEKEKKSEEMGYEKNKKGERVEE